MQFLKPSNPLMQHNLEDSFRAGLVNLH